MSDIITTNPKYIKSMIQKKLAILGIIGLIFGLLFTINPALSVDIVLNLSAVVLIAIGVLQAFKYLRAESIEKGVGSHFGMAFTTVALALFLLFRVNSIAMVITLVASVLFFFHAGSYFQIMLIQIKAHEEKWYIELLITLIAIAAGVYALIKSGNVNDVYMRVIGVLMLILTAIDGYLIITAGKNIEKIQYTEWTEEVISDNTEKLPTDLVEKQ